MRSITKSLFWLPLSLLLLAVPVLAKTKPDYKAIRVSGTERNSEVVQLVDRHEHDRGRGYAWGRRDRDHDRSRWGYRRDRDDYYGHRRYYNPYYYGYAYPYYNPYYYGYSYPYSYSYPYGRSGFSFNIWK